VRRAFLRRRRPSAERLDAAAETADAAAARAAAAPISETDRPTEPVRGRSRARIARRRRHAVARRVSRRRATALNPPMASSSSGLQLFDGVR